MTNEELIKNYHLSSLERKQEISEILFNKNYKLIHTIVALYKREDIYEDLFQEGTMGLLRAIENYNSDKGLFSTHAYININAKIRRYLEKDTIIRIPLRKAYTEERELNTVHSIETYENCENYYTVYNTADSLELVEKFGIINNYLKNSKKRERTIFTMKEFEGYSYADIAKKVNISQQSVQKILKSMKEELIELFKNNDLWEV